MFSFSTAIIIIVVLGLSVISLDIILDDSFNNYTVEKA